MSSSLSLSLSLVLSRGIFLSSIKSTHDRNGENSLVPSGPEWASRVDAISPRYPDDIKSIFYREGRERERVERKGKRERERARLEISQRCFRRCLSAARRIPRFYHPRPRIPFYRCLYRDATNFVFVLYPSPPPPSTILSAKIAIGTRQVRFFLVRSYAVVASCPAFSPTSPLIPVFGSEKES